MFAPWKESYDQPRQHIKKQRHHFADKGSYRQSYAFSSIMYGCESWAIKKVERQRPDIFKLWCWRRNLESPLDCKEIKPVSPKGNQPWLSIGRTIVEAEAPIFWPPDVKSWRTGKHPDDGKDWRQKENGVAEDEIVKIVSPTQWTWIWAYSRDSGGQRNLAYHSPWCHEELGMT